MGRTNTPVAAEEENAILALRAKGFSFREISCNVGRCFETVRKVLLRHNQGIKTQTEAQGEEFADDQDIMAARECLPSGHPVVMRGLWKGLEHRRLHKVS